MIVSTDEIRKHGCLTKAKKCMMLKILKIQDINGDYQSFYSCVSEEKLCCGCCKAMEKIPPEWKKTKYWRLLR